MRKLIVLIFFLTFPFVLLADNNTFPTEQRLFYVERSKNKNIVCYDVKVSGNQLDKSSPVEVYWINREENFGKRKGLLSIQRRLAFGYKVLTKGEFSTGIALNACPDREMKIEQTEGKFQCLMDINKQKAILQKIYVKTKDSNSLKVEYIELTGRVLNSGELISEKIYN
ncbi:MAG: DUF4833 domain-containing protein [Prevotellaceae bacterium]|jgi:hypothetical protein|nr:DUF4833 domain-containing protein [Prevotellaceae bacterium]